MSGGGSLGLGSQKTDASSQQTSDSYGYSGSQSQDMSASTGVSGGQSSSQQNVFASDIFAQLFGNASTAAKSAVASSPELMATAKQLFSGGSQFMSTLGADEGTGYMKDRLSGESPVLDEQIGGLSTDISRLFSEQLLPAIKSRAVAGGTLGGGRQGVAEGMAARAAGDEFTKGATTLRANDINQRDSIAASVATNSLQSAATGLGALPTLLDISERGANEELGVYSTLSGIIGGPTALNSTQSTDFSNSQSIAQAFARSFGENTATSQATSKSKGRGWNFNMSGYGGVGASGGE